MTRDIRKHGERQACRSLLGYARRKLLSQGSASYNQRAIESGIPTPHLPSAPSDGRRELPGAVQKALTSHIGANEERCNEHDDCAAPSPVLAAPSAKPDAGQLLEVRSCYVSSFLPSLF